jgi:hypothetical protein
MVYQMHNMRAQSVYCPMLGHGRDTIKPSHHPAIARQMGARVCLQATRHMANCCPRGFPRLNFAGNGFTPSWFECKN